MATQSDLARLQGVTQRLRGELAHVRAEGEAKAEQLELLGLLPGGPEGTHAQGEGEAQRRWLLVRPLAARSSRGTPSPRRGVVGRALAPRRSARRPRAHVDHSHRALRARTLAPSVLAAAAAATPGAPPELPSISPPRWMRLDKTPINPERATEDSNLWPSAPEADALSS
jgi:hypothetical protein